EIEDAKAAEEERSRAVLEAQAAAAQEQARVDAAFAAAQLELSNELAKEQNERIRDISHLVGRCVIHMRSSDDRDSLLSYLDKKGDKETLNALLDADRRDYVEAWLGSAVRNQKY